MNPPRVHLRPTPFVGYAETARWVTFAYYQVFQLRMLFMGQIELVLSVTGLPVTADQLLDLYTTFTDHLPDIAPEDGGTELMVRLTETQIYHLQRWRIWEEDRLATMLQLTNTLTIGGAIEGAKIEDRFKLMTDVHIRLMRPFLPYPSS